MKLEDFYKESKYGGKYIWELMYCLIKGLDEGLQYSDLTEEYSREEIEKFINEFEEIDEGIDDFDVGTYLTLFKIYKHIPTEKYYKLIYDSDSWVDDGHLGDVASFKEVKVVGYKQVPIYEKIQND